MKIKTIEASGSNEMTTEIGLKRWRGLRYVAEISEFEDEKECTIELQKKVDAMLNPKPMGLTDEDINWAKPEPFTPQPLPSIDYRAKEKLEIDIDNAQSLMELSLLKSEAESNGLSELYVNKFFALSK